MTARLTVGALIVAATTTARWHRPAFPSSPLAADVVRRAREAMRHAEVGITRIDRRAASRALGAVPASRSSHRTKRHRSHRRDDSGDARLRAESFNLFVFVGWTICGHGVSRSDDAITRRRGRRRSHHRRRHDDGGVRALSARRRRVLSLVARASELPDREERRRSDAGRNRHPPGSLRSPTSGDLPVTTVSFESSVLGSETIFVADSFMPCRRSAIVAGFPSTVNMYPCGTSYERLSPLSSFTIRWLVFLSTNTTVPFVTVVVRSVTG